MSVFSDYLATRLARGGFTTEDSLAVFVPLLRQVLEAHDAGLVAPLEGVSALRVDGDRLWFAEADRAPIRRDNEALRRLQPRAHRGVQIVGEFRHDADLTAGTESESDLWVSDVATGASLERPVYVPGYRSFEHVVGHHDPLTDTFVLGLLLASLCLGLDLGEAAEVQRFARHRQNLFELEPDLHPVLAKIITQMTALDRGARPQDLAALLRALTDYREQDFDLDFELQRERGFGEKTLRDRHQIILARLQQRLFEISRRNRLLHYRETQQTVNLTHASVPLTFDPQSLRAEQILIWGGRFEAAVLGRKKVALNSYLDFDEALYLPSLLDKIRSEARKDEAEFGFNNLRLVVCFLRWSDLKGDKRSDLKGQQRSDSQGAGRSDSPGDKGSHSRGSGRSSPSDKERFNSPLLLLPVKLSRKKGVRDAHQLEPLSTEAEVNPVLRYHLRELYDLRLPETIDLARGDVRDLHRVLVEQIQKSEPAVTLQLLEQPRITLIHRRARQRLDQFEKRSRLARRGTRTFPKLDYSYSASDFRPLGLQLFRQKVQPAQTRLEAILDPRMGHRTHAVAPLEDGPPVREVERTFFHLEQGSDNPYEWEFDLCSVTLGNFRYRKMSLVRDYEALLEGLPDNRAFDAVFSLTPPPTGPLPDSDLPLAERYPVVACDPTQSRALTYALGGDSYIIQGPPGTGKSQTITNLIADFVARGKRVLFVCEKRAAIDVVYHRLQQKGLDLVCSLVHDAQADKKGLIADLRATYEAFTGGLAAVEAAAVDRAAVEPAAVEPAAVEPAEVESAAVAPAAAGPVAAEDEDDVGDGDGDGVGAGQGGGDAADFEGSGDAARADVLRDLQRDLEPLLDCHAAMTAAHPELGIPLRTALQRAIGLREHRRDLSAVERESLPAYVEWERHRDGLRRLYRALADAEPSGIFGRHPLHQLRPELAGQDPVGARVAGHLEAALTGLDAVLDVVQTTGAPAACATDLSALQGGAAFAASIEGLATRGRLAILDRGSAAAAELARRLDAFAVLQRAHADAVEQSAGWREPLPPAEIVTALGQARVFEASLWSFLKPAWWRMRRVLRRCFDFDRGAVRPTWSQALTALAYRDRCAGELAHDADQLRREYGFAGDVDAFVARVERLAGGALPPAEQTLRDYFVGTSWGSAGVGNVQAWAALQPRLARVDAELGAVLRGVGSLSPADLRSAVKRVLDHLDALPEFMHCLVELQRLPAALGEAIRTRPWTADQLESALLEAGLAKAVRGDRRVHRFDGRVRARSIERVEQAYDTWLECNARAVRESVQRAFLEDHRLLAMAATQLSTEQKARRKVFSKGLRELQHEFKKTMRYKSIRDLSSGDSGVVLQRLKPVWLMSPLSVSDTLRMSADGFDVVIFDEASQITLEEAVPAIFRAKQIIVVGDEMQLPPTNFFSVRRSSVADDEAQDPATPDRDAIDYDLQGNSFLDHATRNLRSCMLGWHYRSRSESLISFSNSAFYNGALLTVPEERFAAQARAAIRVPAVPVLPVPTAVPATAATAATAAPVTTAATELERRVDDVLERPLSFHFCADGVYEGRRNRVEAEYIAELVRELLRRKTGLSLGIIAFSQAQQVEIEDALERLGRRDPAFGDLLEAEFEREEAGQFLGLLVKNLENIQGDERDIVILSVCYGPDGRGRVRMNFGPINVSGGHKRLNVAFSRARQRMVLVSSMHSTAITNDYNVGANCLKNYLRYAELSSVGDATGAARVLLQMRSSLGHSSGSAAAPHPVAEQLAAALRQMGFCVELSVGQSSFRCSLAVSRAGEDRFRLGVLIDDESYYAEADPLERDMMKPRLLRAFGWAVTHVLSKDWHADADGELMRVAQLLK